LMDEGMGVPYVVPKVGVGSQPARHVELGRGEMPYIPSLPHTSADVKGRAGATRAPSDAEGGSPGRAGATVNFVAGRCLSVGGRCMCQVRVGPQSGHPVRPRSAHLRPPAEHGCLAAGDVLLLWKLSQRI